MHLFLRHGLLCTPLYEPKSDYDPVSQDVRSLLALLGASLCLPDKLILDSFRTCDLGTQAVVQNKQLK